MSDTAHGLSLCVRCLGCDAELEALDMLSDEQTCPECGHKWFTLAVGWGGVDV